ncbi:MAG: glycosyltransferase [Oscillospiraceae bacterium]|nr:glycosyltransferase [Oscillospiraceae bacterium]
MKQIVCMATSPWYPIPTRKQQVMSRIEDAEILYFDPSVTYLAPLKDKAAKKQLSAYRKEGVHPQENITVYALPPVLPFFSRFRWINRINQRKIARFVSKKMREHGFENATLWVYSPVTCDCVDRIDHSALVYDCVDRHSAYGGQMSPAVVDRMEEDLAKKCDFVFATAIGLADRLEQFNRKTRFIPNGANFERFSQAAEAMPCPADMADIPQPIFGFVGALQPCIEYGYVSEAAKAHPEWSFVFIGAEKPGADLLDLKTLPNVHFLGLKPNEELPKYISNFSACLNLFAAGDLSKDVSPLKFYEYLATGKPVVSTPQPDQILQFAPLIEIASSPAAFIDACADALQDTDETRKQLRIEEGRKSSWDARVAQMCETLKQEGVWS